jgi:hypothetical protein
MKFTQIAFVFLFALTVRAQEQDLLAQTTISMSTNQLEVILEEVESDIKAFAENFTVRLDSGSKLKSKHVVSGSLLEPVLNVSVQKCVFIFCQTIELDAAFTLTKLDEASGPTCDYHYFLNVDLRRSSEMLSELYSGINTRICIQKTSPGALVKMKIALMHADTYSTGIVQKQAYSLINLQPESIIESFIKVMKLRGVDDITVLK